MKRGQDSQDKKHGEAEGRQPKSEPAQRRAERLPPSGQRSRADDQPRQRNDARYLSDEAAPSSQNDPAYAAYWEKVARYCEQGMSELDARIRAQEEHVLELRRLRARLQSNQRQQQGARTTPQHTPSASDDAKLDSLDSNEPLYAH